MFIADTLTTVTGNPLSCIFSTTATLGPDEDPLVTTPNNVEGLAHPCLFAGIINGASLGNVLTTDGSQATAVAYAGVDTSTSAGIVIVADISTVSVGTRYQQKLPF